MALDLGDAIDFLRTLAEWPTSSKEQGPARKRVGRWSARAFLAITALTAVALLVAWLRADNFVTFDQTGLPGLSLGVLALLVLLAVHVLAAIVANAMDRRAQDR